MKMLKGSEEKKTWLDAQYVISAARGLAIKTKQKIKQH